jgi:hypothetical protein
MVAIISGSSRNVILAIGLCAALAASSLGFAGSAEARINGPRNTQKAQICGFIQDAYDQDTEDLGDAIDADEYVAILNDRDFWESEWKRQGCDSLYGPLSPAPLPVAPLLNVPLTGSAGPTRR